MDNSLSHIAAMAAVKASKGRFFSVTFTKANGETVKRSGKLIASPDSHKNSPDLFTIKTWKKGQKGEKYASISTKRILQINANKQKISFTR